MADPIDIKLLSVSESVDVGYFDIGIANNGDLVLEDGFDTNLLLSLFCERRAHPYEVATPQLRRGWWGNTTGDEPGFEIGSKLWLLDQSRLTTGALRMAEQYAYDGLSWLQKEGYVTEISVIATPTMEADKPNIRLDVQMIRADSSADYKYFYTWEATGQ